MPLTCRFVTPQMRAEFHDGTIKRLFRLEDGVSWSSMAVYTASYCKMSWVQLVLSEEGTVSETGRGHYRQPL